MGQELCAVCYAIAKISNCKQAEFLCSATGKQRTSQPLYTNSSLYFITNQQKFYFDLYATYGSLRKEAKSVFLKFEFTSEQSLIMTHKIKISQF